MMKPRSALTSTKYSKYNYTELFANCYAELNSTLYYLYFRGVTRQP